MDSERIDKWLWAARFFKTRSLAAKAVSGGKVHLNQERVKPARAIAVGDCLQIRRADELFEVQVLGLSERRGPASTAQTLYLESEASMAAREEQRRMRRIMREASTSPKSRPSKRDRRQIHRFKQSMQD